MKIHWYYCKYSTIKVSINRIRVILFQWGEKPTLDVHSGDSPAFCGRDSVLAQPGSPLGQRRSVCASGVTGITETPGSYAACTLPAPPARGTACRCWRVSAGCTGCDDAARRESRAPNTSPRMTTSIPRSPAAFLQDTREWWGLLAKSVVVQENMFVYVDGWCAWLNKTNRPLSPRRLTGFTFTK